MHVMENLFYKWGQPASSCHRMGKKVETFPYQMQVMHQLLPPYCEWNHYCERLLEKVDDDLHMLGWNFLLQKARFHLQGYGKSPCTKWNILTPFENWNCWAQSFFFFNRHHKLLMKQWQSLNFWVPWLKSWLLKWHKEVYMAKLSHLCGDSIMLEAQSPHLPDLTFFLWDYVEGNNGYKDPSTSDEFNTNVRVSQIIASITSIMLQAVPKYVSSWWVMYETWWWSFSTFSW
jgi:hypothetical protein